jgi:ATP/maltotriose-dependent transcriptional regulator MalT
LEEADKKAAYYEARYKKLSKDNPFRRSTLSSIYYCWATTRAVMCLNNDVYDFDIYFEKLSLCYSKPIDPGYLIIRTPGPWVCTVGSSRKGAPEDFINAIVRSGVHVQKCFINFETGLDDLARGELKYYQGDIQTAESFIARGINRAHEMKKSEIIHRALFYTMRIAVMQGDYDKAQKALNDMKVNLNDVWYFNRYIDYDISLCWFYCTLGQPDKSPDWLKENFSLYAHACFIENYSNQMKGRYCYTTRNYSRLLSYIHNMKQRESFLFGRIEMLVMEACIHYKMKNTEKAYSALEEVYNTASPNDIITPFIELGKDMRTLTSFAIKQNGSIPKSWLEDINRKSASYAKRLAHVSTGFKQANGITSNIVITPREKEILTDLSHGLSRTEIAASRNLSINTVKMLVNNVYSKMGAENLADAIRIATEKKIL